MNPRYLLCLALLAGCIEPPTGTGLSAMDMATSTMDMPAPDMAAEDMAAPDMASLDMALTTQDMRAQEEDLAMSPPDMEALPGSPGHPILIMTASDLDLLHEDSAGKHFALIEDIVLDEDWKRIPEFRGHLDGRGHTISGLSLTQEVVAREACPGEGSEVLFGAFIDRMSAGSLSDLIFADVSVGVGETITSWEGCTPWVGGIVGEISGDSSLRIEDVKITRLNAFVDGHFGGLAYRIAGARLEDTHILGSKGDNTITTTTGSVGGMAQTSSDNATYTRCSVQADITHLSTTELSHIALFIAQVKGITANKIAVRGSLTSPNGLISGGKIRNAGGLFSTIYLNADAMDTVVNGCLMEASLKIEAAGDTGGVFSNLEAEERDLEIKNCAVGELGPGNPALHITAASQSGGFAAYFSSSRGYVMNETFPQSPSKATFSNIFIKAALTSRDIQDCGVARDSTEQGGARALGADLQTLYPAGRNDRSGAMPSSILCNGYESLTTLKDSGTLPNGWDHKVSEDRFVYTPVESWFGPLRDVPVSE